MNDLAVRAVALAVFVAVVGGGAYAASKAFGTEPVVVRLTTPQPEKTFAAGSSAAFEVTVENRGAHEVTVQLAFPGAGPVPAPAPAPAPLHLAAGASARVPLVFDVAALRTGAAPAEVPVQALLDGRPVASLTLHMGVAAATGIMLSSPDPSREAAPGWLVTYPVVLQNKGPVEARVTLRAPGAALQVVAVAPPEIVLAPGASLGAFVTFDLAGAPLGSMDLPIEAVVGPASVANLHFQLLVAQPQAPALAGDTVIVDYVGRFANGTLFDTSVKAVGDGPFAKPADFQRPYQPLTTGLSPSGGTIAGFWQGLVGMGEGMSKTVVIQPEQAYGNATQVTEVPRVQQIPRHSEPQERARSVPRGALTQVLPQGAKVGDTFQVPDQQGNTRVFRVTSLDDANATILWVIAQGDPWTLYPQWPKQSCADTVNDTSVVFLTTPSNPSQPFSFYPFWPNASRITQMTDQLIVVQHSPPVGTVFSVPTQRGPVSAKVVEVTDTTIGVETPNDHPLAGHVLYFDLTVRDVRSGGGAQPSTGAGQPGTGG